MHQLARAERTALHELQARRLTASTRNRCVVIFVVVAAITGSKVADGQEIEVVIVRDAVDEAASAARADGVIALRRPYVRAQEEAVPQARKYDRLRPVGT